jgi:hypothetical protein
MGAPEIEAFLSDLAVNGQAKARRCRRSCAKSSRATSTAGSSRAASRT